MYWRGLSLVTTGLFNPRELDSAFMAKATARKSPATTPRPAQHDRRAHAMTSARRKASKSGDKADSKSASKAGGKSGGKAPPPTALAKARRGTSQAAPQAPRKAARKAAPKAAREPRPKPGLSRFNTRRPWRQEIKGLTVPLHVVLETTADRCSAALRFRHGPGEQTGSMTLWPGYDYTVTYHFNPKDGQGRLTIEQRGAALSHLDSAATTANRASRPTPRSMATAGLTDVNESAIAPSDLASPIDSPPANPPVLVPPVLVPPDHVPPGPIPTDLVPPAPVPPAPLPPSPFPPPPVGMCYCRETGMYRDCPDGYQQICSVTDIQCVPVSTGPGG
jgi:hypothetical protein